MSPSRIRLSGSAIKVLAMASMLTDHAAAFLLAGAPWAAERAVASWLPGLTAYSLMRGFGRLAFPLFAFLLVEGFVHTRSRLRYGVSLVALALLSEIPWNLCVHGAALGPSQNTVFTLLLGYLAMAALEGMRGDTAIRAFTVAALVTASYCLNADYGAMGVALILVMYLLRGRLLETTAVGSALLVHDALTAAAPLSFIPMALYDGTRGFIKGSAGKYAVYAFYPLHLIVLYIIK